MSDAARRLPRRRWLLATDVLVNGIDRVIRRAAGHAYGLTKRKARGLTTGLSAYGHALCLFLTWQTGYAGKVTPMNLISAVGHPTVPRTFAALSNLPFGGEIWR